MLLITGERQVHGARHPHTRGADEGNHTGQHGQHAPQRGGWNLEDPEHPTGEETLDQGDHHNSIDRAMNDFPYPKEQGFAACPLEGKQIRNSCHDPMAVAQQ